MWHIFFIMWVSGSWKWTLIKNLKKSKLDNIYIPLSYKTRNIRENEVNWVDAYFITKEEFYNSIQKWEFLEYALLYDWDELYWTKYKDLIDNWIKKWKIVIKEIDINWLKRLKKEYPNFDKDYTSIFLDIPSTIFEERIKKRWVFMNNDEFNRRKNTMIFEKKEAKKICDYIINANDDEKVILNKALKIIKKKLW